MSKKKLSPETPDEAVESPNLAMVEKQEKAEETTSPKKHVGTKDSDAKLAAAEEKVCKAEKQLENTKETLLRTAAEYENYRKRSQKEFESAFGNGVSHAACELLPIIDTLEAAALAETSDPEYKKGVMLTLAKCNEVLKKLGIHEIEALGEEFDPELHNAIMQEEVEGVESGVITRVIQKGYTLHEKVIRYAMVAVAP